MPTIAESTSRLLRLPDDIKLIREKENIGLTQLARSLGVSKVEVWHWQKGNRIPREPLILLGIMSWADKLRNSAA
jgi:DNA-binding transcriptional regulator YiaG